ncbi:hypothetical protein [Kribbella jiaozuonensis]|uniref:DUF3592 domain-containing protein n=1 Tax=Kribbella jiaozuonensis TaxID=2575441 RepID=A0A4U3LIX0_9ACTN|nr:hypothetical protein [Kribbella jiaozuonensis]TKK75541.1 hypothetical protein FDA38_34690 [Kribbella jiaozuonensis]
MGRVRAVLSWGFVRGPAAAYAFLDTGSALASFASVAAIVLFAAIGAGIGALVGLATPSSVGDAAGVGALLGGGVLVAWLLLSLVVVAVLWVRGVSPIETATGEKPTGRHAAPSAGWRGRGEPLVPVSLVLFCLLMTLAFGGEWVHARKLSRPLDGPTATTTGTVATVHEPPWWDNGSGSADIRYAVAGTDYVIETGRDPGEHFLALDEVVPVEYVVGGPATARCVWTVESARSDAAFWFWLAAGCAGLGLLSLSGFLVGRWRSSGRRGG